MIDYEYIASLVAEIQKGNREAFAEFYAATCQKQYQFAYSYMKDAELAQNALQDTYISALKNIQVLKETSLAVAWLSQINFRICYSMKLQQEKSDPQSTESIEKKSVMVGKKQYTINQILNLPFTESQTILLKYYQHRSIKEISELLDISRSSVKRYLSNAERRLNEILKG